MIDDPAQRDNDARTEPVRKTDIRTTVVAVDLAQLIVSLVVVGIYGVVIIQRGNAPPELNSAMFAIIGALVGRKLPS